MGDPSRSHLAVSMEELGSKLAVGASRSFTIVSCGPDGARLTAGGLAVSVDVITPGGLDVPVDVTDFGDGSYSSSYTFADEGEYEVPLGCADQSRGACRLPTASTLDHVGGYNF